MAQRVSFAVLLVLAEFLVRCPLSAQVPPPTCPCNTQQDFGACLVSPAVNFSGSYPGAVAVVADDIGGTRFSYLYVADLYGGFTFRYDLRPTNGVLLATTTPLILTSPEGSSSTSGAAYNPIDKFLYWAIDDRLVRSDLDLNEVVALGRIDLQGLKERLALPRVGTLGGITFHPARAMFWGVDIVNDVYFEFDGNGKLSEEDGKVVHFKSPALSPFGGGAYGNGITYLDPFRLR